MLDKFIAKSDRQNHSRQLHDLASHCYLTSPIVWTYRRHESKNQLACRIKKDSRQPSCNSALLGRLRTRIWLRTALPASQTEVPDVIALLQAEGQAADEGNRQAQAETPTPLHSAGLMHPHPVDGLSAAGTHRRHPGLHPDEVDRLGSLVCDGRHGKLNLISS
jgi:hypothetical protein